MGRGEDLGDNDSFLEKGIFDSTGILELVSHLENTYNIRLESDELIPQNLDSITSLARFIERKLTGVNAPPELNAVPDLARPRA